MENKKINLLGENAKVIDGKVIIDSEELANAIEACDFALNGEEEAGFSVNFGCRVSGEVR